MFTQEVIRDREYVIGIWNKTGEEIRFNRHFRGHRFTDSEVEKLLTGDTITIENLQSKNGDLYSMIGKLSEQQFINDYGNLVNYIGFDGELVERTIEKLVFTDEAIEKMIEQGGKRWTKGGKDRIYLNDLIFTVGGLKVTLYNTGNISGSWINGEKISHGEARRILEATYDLYVDLETGKIVGKKIWAVEPIIDFVNNLCDKDTQSPS